MKPNQVARHALLAAAGLTMIGLGIYFFWPSAHAPAPQPATEAAASLNQPVPAPEPPPAAEPAPAPAAPSSLAQAPPATPSPVTPPVPTEAMFTLNTTPAGAEAIFDDKPEVRCTTPCNFNLALGRHTLTIRRQGYRETQRVFSLPNEPGLIVSLEAASGTLALVTNPAGLTVIIDGQEQTRKTPANFMLPVGEHRVQVNRGGEKQEFAVDIRDGVISQKNIDWGP